MKSYIYNIEQDELSAWVEAHDYPAFRTKQLNKWLNQGIDDVNQLTNLPKVMRQQLAEDFTFDGLKITSRLVSQIDDTVKYTMLLGMEISSNLSSCVIARERPSVFLPSRLPDGLSFVLRLIRFRSPLDG